MSLKIGPSRKMYYKPAAGAVRGELHREETIKYPQRMDFILSRVRFVLNLRERSVLFW